MTISDLVFLFSVLLVIILIAAAVISAIRGRFASSRRLARLLGLFVALYAVVLVVVSLFMPRRFFPPGQRRCFDDWCVAVLDAEPVSQPAGGERKWMASVEVSSVAKRIRQRAPDARVELEDREGRRYNPCGTGPRPSLSDELGPGESFHVQVPFCLPDKVQPAGVVVHHGDFPGVMIIGADQSWLHAPALLRVAGPANRAQ